MSRLIAINYHYVRPVFDLPHAGIHGITAAQFRAQLAALSQIGTFVGASDILAALDHQRPLPDKAFLVTFDDGLREQFDHALPVLDELGIPALFFANTSPLADGEVSGVHKIHLLRAHTAPPDFIAQLQTIAAAQGVALPHDIDREKATAQYRYDTPQTAVLKYMLNFVLDRTVRDTLIDAFFAQRFPDSAAMIADFYMNEGQLKALAKRGYLGTHAHMHLPLGTLTREQVRWQIAESLQYLETWTGQRPTAISYPYGSPLAAPPWVGEIADAFGLKFGFTIEKAANDDLTEPLMLARFDNNDMPLGKAARYTLENLFIEAPLAAGRR